MGCERRTGKLESVGSMGMGCEGGTAEAAQDQRGKESVHPGTLGYRGFGSGVVYQIARAAPRHWRLALE
jgi:hypothetical protein